MGILRQDHIASQYSYSIFHQIWSTWPRGGIASCAKGAVLFLGSEKGFHPFPPNMVRPPATTGPPDPVLQSETIVSKCPVGQEPCTRIGVLSVWGEPRSMALLLSSQSVYFSIQACSFQECLVGCTVNFDQRRELRSIRDG